MKTKLLLFLILPFSFILPAFAGSASWNLNPGSDDWNAATNWTPATVPNGPGDVATFAISNTTTISLATDNEVNALIFDAGASPYTFAIGTDGETDLSISGAGITNDSGLAQTFIMQRNLSGAVGSITFSGNATAGASTTFISQGGLENVFATAEVDFVDRANAGTATFYGNGGIHGGRGGGVAFFDHATAARGSFIMEGALSTNSSGGNLVFLDSATAGNAMITLNGSDFGNASPGSVFFLTAGATAGNATIVANGAIKAGGFIKFLFNSLGGTSRIQLFGNGTLSLADELNPASITIGSLEGDGIVDLGATLTIGSNSLSTIFSGVIQQDGFNIGSIVKIGAGTLTLSGASTYTGGTTVNAGRLLLMNTGGRVVGTGPVQVNGGTLAGNAKVIGPITIGSGSGTGAVLAPGKGTSSLGRLTTKDMLTFNADGTYSWLVRSDKTAASQVIANGVTISGGAQFSATDGGNSTLPVGTEFTVISNKGPNAISGAFSNLADGAIVNVNGNNLQASYTGGDGNDLTLTVVF